MTRHAFICGCPRSGTTFLATLLNAHPAVAIGIERYGNRFMHEPLTPALFEEERFFRIEPGDTFYDSLDFSPVYAAMRAGFAAKAIVGDKIPLLFDHLDAVARAFDRPKIVFCVRNIVDVAASYDARARNPDDATWDRGMDATAAVTDWNRSLAAYARARGAMDVFLFDYDLFTGTGMRQVRSLLAWLGLEIDDRMRRWVKAYIRHARTLEANRARTMSGDVLRDLCLRADMDGYRAAVDRPR